MRRSLILTSLVLVSLLVGAVAYAATATVATTDSAPLGFMVPIGRIGDVAEFRIRDQEDLWEMDGGELYEEHTDQEHSVAIRPAAIVPQVDPTGLVHQAVEVQFDGALVQALRTSAVPALDGVVDLSATGRSEVAKVFLDLDTRHQLKGVLRLADSRWGSLSLEVLGPSSDMSRSPEFAFQGLELRFGQDITEQLYPAWFQVPSVWVNQAWSRSARAVVAHQGEYEGEPVLGIQEDVWYNTTYHAWPTRDGRSETHWSSLSWLSASSPYPVYRIQRVWENYTDPVYNDTLAWTRTSRLRHYEPGSQPIPWAPRMVDASYRTVAPDLERSGQTVTYPTDGDARLPFPLAKALQAVSTDPGLVGWKAWQLTNPGHRLAGYLLRPTQTQGAAGHEWILTFAAPGSDTAYRVRTSLVAGAAPVSQEQGPLVLRTSEYDHRYRADAFPADPATIGAAIDHWRKLRRDHAEESLPTHIAWAYGSYRECEVPAGSSPTRCPGDSYAVNRGPRLLRLDIVDGLPSPSGSPRVVPTEARVEHVWFDTKNGILFHRRTYDQFWDYTGWIGGKLAGEAQPQPVAPSEATLQGPGPIVGAAVATTSLLALLLAVYFLPLLREAGTRALLALPFYARLRKDELLNNQFRDSILHLVRENPGLDATRIHASVGGGWSTVIYHLGVLEKNQVLSSLVDGRHRYFFPVGEFDFGRRDAIAVMQNERTRHIHGLLQEHPGLRRQELAQRVGISVPAIAWHLERLERVGLVGADRARRHHQYYASPMPISATPIGVEFS